MSTRQYDFRVYFRNGKSHQWEFEAIGEVSQRKQSILENGIEYERGDNNWVYYPLHMIERIEWRMLN